MVKAKQSKVTRRTVKEDTKEDDKGVTKEQSVQPAQPVDDTTTAGTTGTTGTAGGGSRGRARDQRSFEEAYTSAVDSFKQAREALKTMERDLKLMNRTHKAVVRKNTKQGGGDRKARRPTTSFTQELVDYIRNSLEPSELVINHKQKNSKGEDEVVTVDLSNLSTDSLVHRTDVTQLLKAVFKKKGIINEDDKRFINYKKDSDLVRLLTEGYVEDAKDDEKRQEREREVEQIKRGEYTLSYFNIHKFCSRYMVTRDSTANTTA